MYNRYTGNDSSQNRYTFGAAMKMLEWHAAGTTSDFPERGIRGHLLHLVYSSQHSTKDCRRKQLSIVQSYVPNANSRPQACVHIFIEAGTLRTGLNERIPKQEKKVRSFYSTYRVVCCTSFIFFVVFVSHVK